MEEGYSLPSVLMAGTRYCWMSTGLYIPGRQIIEVSLPEAAASADLKVWSYPISLRTLEPRCSCFMTDILLILLKPCWQYGACTFTHLQDEATEMQNS